MARMKDLDKNSKKNTKDFKKQYSKAERKAIKQRAKEIKNTLIKEARLREKSAEADRKIETRALRENWYKLDNSALIYPAIDSSEWNSVFRLTVTMKDEIRPDLLQKALDDNMKRYPFFNVSLRDGLFWHYFQSLTTKPVIEMEHDYPCRHFVFDKSNPIFRVLYFNKTISYESFHSLADGGGAIQFFNTLIVRYCQLCGVNIANMQKYNLNVLDLPDDEESEDAFERFADGGKARSRKEEKAYEVTGAMDPIEVLHVITGRVKLTDLKAKAKEYNATINEFLSAVYMKVLIEEKHRASRNNKKPVKLSVPVNLRRLFPSRTMRNFSQFLNITIPVEKEDSEFKELVEIVKEDSKALTKEYVLGVINANVSSEKNYFVRIMPLIIKDAVLNLVYSFVGERLFTSTISNLGIIKLPPEVSDQIQDYNALLGATKLNRLNLAVMSFNDETVLTITTRLRDRRMVRRFYTILAELGLDVTVESNQEVE